MRPTYRPLGGGFLIRRGPPTKVLRVAEDGSAERFPPEPHPSHPVDGAVSEGQTLVVVVHLVDPGSPIALPHPPQVPKAHGHITGSAPRRAPAPPWAAVVPRLAGT